MVGEMETKEKPKPTPDYLMQLMNDKKLMSSLPNFCGIFNHLERLLDEGESPRRPFAARAWDPTPAGVRGRRGGRGRRGLGGPGGARGGGAGAGLAGRGGRAGPAAGRPRTRIPHRPGGRAG